MGNIEKLIAAVIEELEQEGIEESTNSETNTNNKDQKIEVTMTPHTNGVTSSVKYTNLKTGEDAIYGIYAIIADLSSRSNISTQGILAKLIDLDISSDIEEITDE